MGCKCQCLLPDEQSLSPFTTNTEWQLSRFMRHLNGVYTQRTTDYSVITVRFSEEDLNPFWLKKMFSCFNMSGCFIEILFWGNDKGA